MKATEIKEKAAAVGVCAWCRFEYDPKTGTRIRHLSDEGYARTRRDGSSHGCCATCGRAMKAQCEDYRVERGAPDVCRHCHCEIGGGCALGCRLTDAEYALLPVDECGDRNLGCCSLCRDRLDALEREDALAVKVHLVMAAGELDNDKLEV